MRVVERARIAKCDDASKAELDSISVKFLNTQVVERARIAKCDDASGQEEETP